jgi:hypothetical protein
MYIRVKKGKIIIIIIIISSSSSIIIIIMLTTWSETHASGYYFQYGKR